MTGSPRDKEALGAQQIGLSHWAVPSVTGSARLSQKVVQGVRDDILAKGK